MEKKDINKLLALRGAWDKLRAVKAHTEKDLAEFYGVTWKYGIETQHQIADFNDSMIRQFIVEYLPLKGSCDKCKGYKGTPPCVTYYGKYSCFSTAKTTGKNVPFEQVEKNTYEEIFMGIKMGIKPEFPSLEVGVQISDAIDHGKNLVAPMHTTHYTFSTVCPPGHGYYNQITGLESWDDIPFDIYWSI